MKEKYSSAQISRIIDQALVYQCACSAQICRTLLELRDLWAYQQKCIGETDTDKAVHRAIAESTESAHAEYERCLDVVLKLEGWDLETLKMPALLKAKALKL